MKRASLCVVALAALLGGCSGDDPEPDERRPAQQAEAAPEPPGPRAPVPRDPDALAERVTATDEALAAAVERWRGDGGLDAYPPPRDVTLHALHQQRIHLLLTVRPALAERVLPLLAGDQRSHARATIRARRGLGRITPPTPGRYRTGPPEPPRRLLAYYRQAQRRFGVPWHVLAAVNFVESAFGRMRNSSAAGAQGPMQFIPSTWQAYGMGGDVNDPRDAILGAANYLSASGAPGDLAGALYSYNPSDHYVRAVLAYTERIRRGAFLSYYAWQVFVRVPGGTRRITGPRPF
jgi:soluble lytic murein transglycosylase-like protein